LKNEGQFSIHNVETTCAINNAQDASGGLGIQAANLSLLMWSSTLLTARRSPWAEEQNEPVLSHGQAQMEKCNGYRSDPSSYGKIRAAHTHSVHIHGWYHGGYFLHPTSHKRTRGHYEHAPR
jgi:hypothetical protein